MIERQISDSRASQREKTPDEHKNTVGLILLGNSGVGKSFLANILLGRNVFKHDFSARSVTHETESEVFQLNRSKFIVFNIPGLIEANQKRIELNKQEIYRAFDQQPNALILYVFGHQNGRVHDEDVVAFHAIKDAYPFRSDSLILVMNGLPSDRPNKYDDETRELLIERVKCTPKAVIFVDYFNKKNPKMLETLRNNIIKQIIVAKPQVHVKEHDINLNVDEVTELVKEVNLLRTQLEEELSMHFLKTNQQENMFSEFMW
ncbi:unnamed protein product [Rotaria sp. Silwood1]|nr:unnamed protein product [Rotaria sp. Silwood1]